MPARDLAYLDHNATTPVRPEVLEAMLPWLKEGFGNPSSPYAFGQKSRAAVEAARAQAARLVNAASASEIVFTSCGSESDVLAIEGAAEEARERSSGAKNHIVASAIEHDAIILLLERLALRGFETTLVGVGADGLVDPGDVERAIRPSTSIVSVMHANNEVGTIQPVKEIAALCRPRGVLFHTDAVQSAGKVPIDVQDWRVDLLSISGHKINAPKGVGALYIRRGLVLSPVITGHQEKNRRGGTENVASIAGLGKACELAGTGMAACSAKLLALRERLENACLKIEGCKINGHPAHRLPNTCHASFEGVEGFELVVALDLEGICVSSGPACSTGAPDPSHVLRAMGLGPETAKGSLRISLGWGSTERDVDRLAAALPAAVRKLRKVRTA